MNYQSIKGEYVVIKIPFDKKIAKDIVLEAKKIIKGERLKK